MTQRPEPEPEPTPEPDSGGLRPLGPGPLVVLGLVALVAGWSVRRLAQRLDFAEPLIGVWGVVVIWLLAAGVAWQAWWTWRRLQRRREPLEPYRAVNRLVLGQAAALGGVAVLGWYAGSVLSHLGAIVTQLTDERMWRGGLAAAGGLALMLAGLWLERACRVPEDPAP